MSTLKVNNIESFTGTDPVTITDELRTHTGSAVSNRAVAFGADNNAQGVHYRNLLINMWF